MQCKSVHESFKATRSVQSNHMLEYFLASLPLHRIDLVIIAQDVETHIQLMAKQRYNTCSNSHILISAPKLACSLASYSP